MAIKAQAEGAAEGRPGGGRDGSVGGTHRPLAPDRDGSPAGRGGPAPERDGRARGPSAADRRNTRQLILDIAEELVQVRGFNAFSYAPIAAELGITKASLHYHFPGKAELGQALIARYAERFAQALRSIDDAGGSAPTKLAGYAKLYADVVGRRRMCLCGMLAAEYETLPDPIRTAVLAFFDENERWLSRVLAQGRKERSLQFEGSPRATARMIISSLEGAMLIARSYDDERRFDATAKTLLAGFSPRASPPAP